MATFTNVDTDQVRQTAQSIRQNIDNMKVIKNALDSDILSKLATCWQGEAKDFFSQQFTSFCVSFKTLIDGYEALNNDIESADAAYSQANEIVTGEINRLS